MTIITPMFISDCVVIGTFTQLLFNIHIYLREVDLTRKDLPSKTAAKAHAYQHYRMATLVMLAIGIYTAVKALDTVLQVGHPRSVSPMELWLNGSLVLLGIAITLFIFHLRDEENLDHPFYSMWHMGNGHDK